MRVVIAPDKFKGSMTGLQVAEAIEEGLRQVFSDLEAIKIPMADGGEGTVRSLVDATNGEIKELEVTGPLGERQQAYYGILGDHKTAVIEMAAASGLALVPRNKRNPAITTTRGTGELIKAALDEGCTKIIVGIGGSATNDAGAGMAQALGVRLLDASGSEIGQGGAELARLARIETSGLDPRLKSGAVEIVVACDVNNPLVGPTGASYVYGPQKGASPEQVRLLDEALANFSRVVLKDLGLDVAKVPGAGAAGGLGAGLIAFLNGRLQSGIDIVLKMTKLAEMVDGADLVITGEGAMDWQTAYGKAPAGVAKVAKGKGLPVVAIVGSIGSGLEEVYKVGIDAVFSIINKPCSLEEAMSNGPDLVATTAENVARLWSSAGKTELNSEKNPNKLDLLGG